MAVALRTRVRRRLRGYASRAKNRIPYESGNYPYVTARVRAKKALLFSEDVYTKMLQMEIPQIARILGEGMYKEEVLSLGTKLSGVDLIEVATSRRLAAVFAQIIGFSEGELGRMTGWYLDRFDVQNIKTIVRGKVYGAAAQEIMDGIVAAGSMRERFLRELVETPTLDGMFDRLSGTIYAQALDALGLKASEMRKWSEWEDRATQMYYQNLLNVVPERTEGMRLMRRFVRRDIDLVNLGTLLRLWASGATLPYDPFVDGGLEIPRAALAEMVALDANALAARLRQYPFTEDLAAHLKMLRPLGVGQLVRSVEKAHLLETEKFAHLYPLSIVPVLDYVVRMEREVQNIRIIARGKESHLPAETIRDLLVI